MMPYRGVTATRAPLPGRIGRMALSERFIAQQERMTGHAARRPGGRTGVAEGHVIGALQPALTLLAAGRLFGERVTVRHAFWTRLATAGVFVSVLGASGNAVWSLWGDLLAAAALVLWTVYFLLSKRVRERVPATEYMTS